jgi:CubicO group peptidase (beta-lactamase class C family)
MSRRFLKLILTILVLAIAAAVVTPAPAQDTAPYWPTDQWRTSTPEEQGIDSARLADMLATVRAKKLAIDSVLVTRNGYIVAEVYTPPTDPVAVHQLYSCTKSVTSALVGIAIGERDLEGVSQPVLSFFADGTFQNLDANKQALTLESLLTMSAGLDWADEDMALTYQMVTRRDWVQFVLDRPTVAPPGTTFVYNNGLPHILSAILQEVTGMPAATFAQQKLFDPLGIAPEAYKWETDWLGISTGSWGLWMNSRDMAKFGYLFLNNGEWDGQQVVPADWVEQSTRSHIAVDDRGHGYGYLWWVYPEQGYYAAQGLGGQYIFVVPSQAMVVVFTSNLEGDSMGLPITLLDEYILPAAQSVEPLPANPEAAARLDAEIEALGGPD